MATNPLIQQLSVRLQNFKSEQVKLEERCRAAEAAVEQGKQENAELKRQHEASMAKQREELSVKMGEDMTAEQEKHEAEIEKLKEFHRTDRTNLIEEHRKQLAVEMQNCESRMEAINAVNRKSEDDLKAKHANELNELHRKLNETQQQLEKKNLDHEADIQQLACFLADWQQEHETPPSADLKASSSPDKILQRAAEDASAIDTEQLSVLQEENDNFQRQLSSAKGTISQLNQRLKQLEDQSSNAERKTLAECDQLRQRIVKLEGELKEERGLLGKAQENHEMELGLARKEVDAKAAKLDASQEQLKQTMDKAASAKQELQRLQGELDPLRRSEEALRRSLAERQRQLEEKEGIADNLQKKLAETQADWQRKLPAAEEELADKQRKLAAAEKALAALQHELSAVQERENQYLKTTNELTDRLRNQADEHEVRIKELKRREEQLYARMSEETRVRKKAEKSISMAEEQIRRLRELLDSERKSAAEQLQQAKQQRDVDIGTCEQFQARLMERQRRLDELERENKDLQQEMTRRRNERATREQRLAQLQAQFDEAQQKLQQSEETKNLLESILADYQRGFAKERQEKEKYRDDCEKLRESLDRRIDEAATESSQQQPQEQQGQQGSSFRFFKRHRQQ